MVEETPEKLSQRPQQLLRLIHHLILVHRPLSVVKAAVVEVVAASLSEVVPKLLIFPFKQKAIIPMPFSFNLLEVAVELVPTPMPVPLAETFQFLLGWEVPEAMVVTPAMSLCLRMELS